MSQAMVRSVVATILSACSTGFAAPPGGTLLIWGPGASVPQLSPPSDLGLVQRVWPGHSSIVAKRQDGSAVCWGDSRAASVMPTSAGDLIEVSSTAGCHERRLGLRADGSMIGWGSGCYEEPSPLPSAITGLARGPAGAFQVVVDDTGRVDAWGYNGYGQCNVPSDARSGVKAVSKAQDWAMALKTDGTILAWGQNYRNQTSVPLAAMPAKQVAAGWQHGLSLKVDGTLAGWGDNSSGQMAIPSGTFDAIDALVNTSLGLRADGTVTVWGEYANQLQAPTDTSFSSAALGWEDFVTDRPLIAGIVRGPIPSIAGVIPSSGPSLGGTPVTIRGTNFVAPAIVRIAGQLATSVSVVSDTTISAITPPSLPGNAYVSVNGVSVSNAFYYRPECGSDLDQNGSVDAGDISIILLDFGPCYSNAASTQPDDSTPFMLQDQPAAAAPKTRREELR
jgi:hypothetical protein